MPLPLKNSKPKTVKEAVELIVANLSTVEREHVKEVGLNRYHFSGGMQMRNEWSLWEKDSPIKLDAIKTYYIAHADDISGLIFDWATAIVRNEPFDPMEAAERYDTYWRSNYGQSALEAGGIDDAREESARRPVQEGADGVRVGATGKLRITVEKARGAICASVWLHDLRRGAQRILGRF